MIDQFLAAYEFIRRIGLNIDTHHIHFYYNFIGSIAKWKYWLVLVVPNSKMDVLAIVYREI